MSPTGRISSSMPDMQTLVPRTEIGDRLRDAFVRELGTRWVETDFSDLEHRLMADMPSVQDQMSEQMARYAATHGPGEWRMDKESRSWRFYTYPNPMGPAR